jgi:hypothetical protein
MNIAQANAVQATEGLTGNIKHMNETVLRALIDINATAVRVNQTINSYSFYSNFLSLAGATVIDCEDDRNASPCHVATDPLVRETNIPPAPSGI